MNTEYLKLTREQLEQIVKNVAHSKIVGHFFVGEFGPQLVRWLDDGGIEVITEYQRGELVGVPEFIRPRRKQRYPRKNNQEAQS